VAAKVGINGFGRIGRQVFKIIQERFADELDVVAVNDLTDNETLVHLLKYDSVYGKYPGTVEASGEAIIVDGKSIAALEIRDPKQLPWGDMGVDIVLESTGVFREVDKAAWHLDAGASKVIISAPARGECRTVVLGVNDKTYDPANDHIISNASCTTNCLAPLCKVLNDSFGISHGFMTTVHSYTSDQRLLDFPHSDLRRARSAAINIIPTKTGAAAAIGLVIPELAGKMDGMAMRVPTPTGSIVDLVVEVEQEADTEAINAAFLAAASEGDLAPYLDYCDEPIVQSDIVGDPASCIFDSLETRVIKGTGMVKVLGWYDNEWGYSSRTVELMKLIADQGW